MLGFVVRNLAQLEVGQSAAVLGVDGTGATAVRLLEMGLVPGTHVKLVKRAPMGDPLQFQLRGYHLSLRRLEAASVRAEIP
jgi:Fe2+ transport system protein FeoA